MDYVPSITLEDTFFSKSLFYDIKKYDFLFRSIIMAKVEQSLDVRRAQTITHQYQYQHSNPRSNRQKYHHQTVSSACPLVRRHQEQRTRPDFLFNRGRRCTIIGRNIDEWFLHEANSFSFWLHWEDRIRTFYRWCAIPARGLSPFDSFWDRDIMGG